MVRNGIMNKEKILIIEKFLLILFAVIIFYITMLSIFSTSLLGEFVFENGEINKEHTFFIEDNFILLLICCMFVTGAGYFIHERIRKVHRKYAQYFCMVMVILLEVGFLLLTDIEPRDDQRELLMIASQMRKGEFSAFAKGGYISACPHQAGMLLYLYILTFIGGPGNYLLPQFLNILYLLGVYVCIAAITKEIWGNNRVSEWTFVLSLSFVPIFFYTSFVYGTLPGLFFALLSVLCELRFISTVKFRYAVCSAVFISTAIQFKSNYLVFFIAILGIAVLEGLRRTEKREKKLFAGYILVAIVIYLCSKGAVGLWIENITGYPLNKGIPAIAYVVMGIQDGKAAPGWWNFYNWNVYENNGYDYIKTTSAAVEDFLKQIRIFQRDIKYAISFFVRKIASIWNNPTFEGLDILKYREGNVVVGNVWGLSLVYGSLSRIITYYLNILHSFILLGVGGWIIGRWRKIETKEMICPLCFIGGFTFHIFWEAKCQYTIPYFILLFPYTIYGYKYICGKIKYEAGLVKINLRERKKVLKRICVLTLMLVFLFGVSRTNFFHNLIALNENEQYYKEYISIQKEQYP